MGWWGRLLHRQRQEGRLEAELGFHLERQTADHLALGMPAAEARRRALAQFGGLEFVKEECRDARGTQWLEALVRDVRFAVRMLRRSPGFAAVAILTLALGLGANAAIFNLVNAVVLRPLPVPHPQQLALLTDPNSGGTYDGIQDGARDLLAYSEYRNLRDHAGAFASLLAAESNIQRQGISWSGNGRQASPQPAFTQLVSANFFSTLGIGPFRGRLFARSDASTPDAAAFAVITDGYWKRQFGRDPDVLGKRFHIDTNPTVYTVIGVTPPGFTGITSAYTPDIFLPLAMTAQDLPGRDRLHDAPGVSRVMWLQVLGRRQPGATLEQANQDANLVFHQSMEKQAAAAADAATRQRIFHQELKVSDGASGVSALRPGFAGPLLALLALVGLVLLMATVNLASLLLARAAGRQKEMGIRLALGAGGRRVIRQLLTESLLLACAGGGLGAGLAVWGEPLVVAMVSPGTGGISLNLAPDWRVFAFTAFLCVLAGVLFGLAPAWRAARLDVNQSLQTQGRGGASRSRHLLDGLIRGGLPLGKLLVMAQVALSILLVAGAGLLIRSLQNLQNANLGFQSFHLAETSLDLSPAGYQGPAAAAAFDRFLRQSRAIAGVQGVALSGSGLFENNDCGIRIGISSTLPPPGQPGIHVGCDYVSADYFAVAGIPLLLGRALDPQDQSGSVIHAVINQAMQKKYFADADPIGRQLRDLTPDDKGAVYTIVGVCANFKTNSVDEKIIPSFYVPFFDNAFFDTGVPRFGTVLVREAGPGAPIAAALRRLIPRLDSRLQPSSVQMVPSLIDSSLFRQRLLARLSGFFGIVALLLAAIGLYGVTAYSVARRSAEVGVRMALGAGPGTIVGMILGESGVIVLIGLFIGLPLSLAGTKLITSQIPLFGLHYYDPASLAMAAAILTAVALLAGLLPAVRAARIGPAECLRLE